MLTAQERRARELSKAVQSLSRGFVTQKKKEKPKSLDFLDRLTGLNIPKKHIERKPKPSKGFKIPYESMKTKEVVIREVAPSAEDMMAAIIPLVRQHLAEIGTPEITITPEMVKQIIQIMHTLPENDKLEVSKGIRNYQSFIYKGTKYGMEEMMHGGASTGGGITIVPITGTINDTNVTFTSTSEPTLLNINGAFYQTTGGVITWTYVAGTITLSSPVGTGGSIYGII